MVDVQTAQALYDGVRRWFAILPPFVALPTFFIGAPFGRFALTRKNILVVDGIRAWMFMELVAILAFLNAFLRSPLSPTAAGTAPPLTPRHPPTLLAALFLAHYANRALVSPLRTPSRSASHLSVVLSAVAFNTANGSLLGAYLASPAAARFLAGAFASTRFWAGVALWAAGFVGNVVHDEILLDLRRGVKAKGKGRAQPSADDDDKNNGKDKDKDASSGQQQQQQQQQEHYAIPHGLLYRYVSYPNYLCEWAEWLGFALAAAPPPSGASLGAVVATLAPPWLFLCNEVWLMLPRAYMGHRWYRERFPDYPRERKAVVPFVF